jgi:hypothetical protein
VKFPEDVGALPCGACGKVFGPGQITDKIASQQNRIGLEAVDSINRLSQEKRFRELVHVNIAELDNTDAIEGGRESTETNLDLRDLNPMPLKFACVERQPRRAKDACFNKTAPGNWRPG